MIAKSAFDLVNKYRKQNGRKELAWDSSLSNLAMGHSKDMASGKVPFGHQGFDKRSAAIPFRHGAVAENVAYSQGVSDPVKVKCFD